MGVGDRELLDRFIARRDETAFACLVQRHGRTIWGVCRRVLQKEQEADDAYQAVFIVLSRKAASIRKGEAVGSWLYRVAYRIAMKARVRLHRRREREKQLVLPDIPFEDSPLGEAALREMQRILDEEVERLTDKFRAPFVLCCLEGTSKPEAARALGCSLATVKARLVQARKILKGRLARRGITLSAVLTAVALAQTSASAAPTLLLPLSMSQTASPASLALAESFGSMGAAKLTPALAACLVTIATLAAAAAMGLQTMDAPAAGGKAVATGAPETFLAPPTPVIKEHDEQVLAEQQPVQVLAYAPDGKSFAVAGRDKTVQVRDALSGELRRVLAGHSDFVNCVAISPDGTTLASGSADKTIKLWNLATGNAWATIRGHDANVLALAFARDGTLASASEDRLIKWWDRPKGRGPITFQGHDAAVRALAFAPDGTTLASAGDDRTIRLWSLATASLARVRSGHASAIRALAFSPDGILASAADDGAIMLWGRGDDDERSTLTGHTGAVTALAFTPRGTLVSGGEDSLVIVWDPATGKPRTQLAGHKGPVRALAVHPQGDHLVTGGDDATLLRWRSATAAQPPSAGVVVAANDPVPQPSASDLHVPLKARPDNLPRMQLVGRHAVKCLQFEPAGMRITVPQGPTGIDAHAVLSTGIRLNGDFEATVNFEILHLPEPEEAGPETGITMSVRRDKTEICISGITRRVVKKGGPQFSAWCTWFDWPGKPSRHEEQLSATTAKSGRLRLVRTGSQLSYYASTSADAELALLNKISIGTQSLDDLRLLGFTGDPRASLDARFWDLHIRGGTAAEPVAATENGADEPAPTKSRSRLWLTLLALLASVFAVLCGLMVAMKRKGSHADGPATDAVDAVPAPARRFVTFSCPCGKGLKARTELAGKKLKCPGCGGRVLIPAPPQA